MQIPFSFLRSREMVTGAEEIIINNHFRIHLLTAFNQASLLIGKVGMVKESLCFKDPLIFCAKQGDSGRICIDENTIGIVDHDCNR